MKGGRTVATVAGVALFIGGVVWISIPKEPARCELCIEWEGREICRRGAGQTEADARRAAQQSACGGNARGMSESIRCNNLEPVRATCTGS